MPLGDALRKLLAELQPAGRRHRSRGALGRAARRAATLPVKGLLSGLSLAAARRRASRRRRPAGPAQRDASQLDASETRRRGAARHRRRRARAAGRVRRAAAAARPARRPAALEDRAASQPARRPGAPRRSRVQVKDARFANADAQGELSATWRTGGAAAGVGRGGRLSRPARARRQARRRRAAARPRATCRSACREARAQLRRARGARRHVSRRHVPRQGRPVGLPVLQRAQREATASSASPPRSRTSLRVRARQPASGAEPA